MPGALLQQDRVATGSVASAQASIATMPITNLQDPQPRRRTRLMGNSATITADLGAEVPVDCVALISTTLGAGAMVQARLSNFANFSGTLADTVGKNLIIMKIGGFAVLLALLFLPASIGKFCHQISQIISALPSSTGAI